MRLFRTIAILFALAPAGLPRSVAAERSLFEWSAVAPLVVVAQGLGDNGKYSEVRVQETLRGTTVVGEVLRVDLSQANRERDRMTQRRAAHLDEGTVYTLLLRPAAPRGKPKAIAAYELVRGVQGIRELPGEGAELTLLALRTMIEIQDTKSDSVKWLRLESLLEQSNPVLLENTLDQFIKFRRGSTSLLESLRPLLEHPDAEMRVRAARLIGQILSAAEPAAQVDTSGVRTDLISRAKRDPEVSVRVAATEALDEFADLAAVAVLQEIAADDPDQNVRFAAERLLFERRDRRYSAGPRAAGGARD